MNKLCPACKGERYFKVLCPKPPSLMTAAVVVTVPDTKWFVLLACDTCDCAGFVKDEANS